MTPPTDSSKIVNGPLPDEYGNACFVVQIGSRRVDAIADACGAGVEQADADVYAEVSGVIADFRRQSPERLQACLREAAQLRRAAGNATELEVLVPKSVVVQPHAVVDASGVRFDVRVGFSTVQVLVTRDGAIVDDYDPAQHPRGELAADGLLTARRAVLDFVLAQPERAGAWGVDSELLELLWL